MSIVRKTIGLLLGISAIGGFIVGVWMGLARLGWVLGSPPSAGAHAPLLALAVLGTLIGAERAVALSKSWVWAGPMASGLAVATIITGASVEISAVLLAVAGSVLVAVFTTVHQAHPATHIAVMGVGAVAFVGAAIALAVGAPIPSVVPLLASFLVITITGERLELAHLGMGTSGKAWFIVSVTLVGVGSVATAIGYTAGTFVVGAAFVSLALWLARFDIARRTVKMRGSTRYIAVSLLIGYAWLGIAGLFWMYYGLVPATPGYDTGVHAVFLGFVMSMVFGHAIIVVPVFTGMSFPYHRLMWVPLVFLHGSITLRAIGDVSTSFEVKQWGGMLTATALAMFALVAVGTVMKANLGTGSTD